jgi:hypothetical protein
LRTRAHRPELFAKYELSSEDRTLLAEADADDSIFVAFSDPPPRHSDVEGAATDASAPESHRAPRTPAA